MRKFNLSGRHQQGMAVVELTLVAPLMFLLIFASAEFGRLIYQYNALTNIVRDAGRYLSDQAYIGNTNIPVLTDDAKAETTNLIIAGDINGQSEMLPGLASAIVNYQLNGELVTINVIYNWTPLFADLFFSISDNSAITLNFPMQVTYTMRAS